MGDERGRFLRYQEGYIHRNCTRTCGEGVWKTNLSTPDKYSILDLPVIGSLVYRKNSAKNHPQFTRPRFESEIRTSISPPSAVELNTTSALANYATEAGEAQSLKYKYQRDLLGSYHILPDSKNTMSYSLPHVTICLGVALCLLACDVTCGPLSSLTGGGGSDTSQQNQSGGDFLLGLINALVKLHVNLLNNVNILSPLLDL
uniref:Uncharacterized protein n=1 Tax=Timema shepardi TaxID=629360 RepID=A0A7R9B335_TIMSH|nr:unnamed protein product [Timema shepardi]